MQFLCPYPNTLLKINEITILSYYRRTYILNRFSSYLAFNAATFSGLLSCLFILIFVFGRYLVRIIWLSYDLLRIILWGRYFLLDLCPVCSSNQSFPYYSQGIYHALQSSPVFLKHFQHSLSDVCCSIGYSPKLKNNFPDVSFCFMRIQPLSPYLFHI